jgi:multiple sugar transport system substrate-binding protein
VAVADVLTTLKADTVAGDPPAVAQIGWSKMAEAYRTLPIKPVQEIPSQQDWQRDTAGMAPNLLAAVADGGVVKAMPFTMSIPTVFYNADLFRAAGLDPEHPPTTIAELKADALAIKAHGAEGAYVAVVDSGKSDYLTQSVVNSAGGSLVGPGGQVGVDSPQAVAALSEVADLTRSGAQPGISAKDAVALFGGGKLGMLVGSTAALVSLEGAANGKFDLRTTGFPRFGDGPARPTYSGAGLAVLSDDPAVQQAAWTFIEFLTSEQSFTTITSKIGYLPLRPAIVDDPAYLKDYFAKDPRLKPSLAQLADVTPYTAFPGGKSNEAVVVLQDEAVEPIVLRGADPAATLGAAATKIRGLTGP